MLRILVSLLTLLFGVGTVTAANLWDQFSRARALAQVQKLVDFGPRPAGSEALEKSRVYLTEQLQAAGWKVARQTFTAPTPEGPITFVNLIATFGEKAAPTFLLCSHYDTKVFQTFRFVGANDGGSSTGLLLEMARVLATDPALASGMELVFFDGEEAVENWSDTDGVYGSRYFAANLPKPQTLKGGILFDMVGDKSLTVTMPPSSPRELVQQIFAAADALKLRKYFTYFDREITDDHTPLNAAGIPVIDLIDFDYPPWHTAEDTMDKISAESLQIVGQVALRFLQERR